MRWAIAACKQKNLRNFRKTGHAMPPASALHLPHQTEEQSDDREHS